MQTLDFYMIHLCPKYLIDYKDLTTEVTVDVRTMNEYKTMNLLDYNLPVINEKEYDFLQRYKSIAGIVVLYGLLRNLKVLKINLLEISEDRKRSIVVACSKGRLRSPMVWIYAKLLNIDTKVLKGGVHKIPTD